MDPPVVLGTGFGGAKIAVVAFELTGPRLASAVVHSLPDQNADAPLDPRTTAAPEMLGELGGHHRLAPVGAATFGIPLARHVGRAPPVAGRK